MCPASTADHELLCRGWIHKRACAEEVGGGVSVRSSSSLNNVPASMKSLDSRTQQQQKRSSSSPASCFFNCLKEKLNIVSPPILQDKQFQTQDFFSFFIYRSEWNSPRVASSPPHPLWYPELRLQRDRGFKTMDTFFVEVSDPVSNLFKIKAHAFIFNVTSSW